MRGWETEDRSTINGGKKNDATIHWMRKKGKQKACQPLMRGNEKGGEEATGSVMREVGCCTNPSFHLAAFASNPSGRRLPMPPLTSAIFCPALSIDFGGLSHCKGLGGEGGLETKPGEMNPAMVSWRKS
jgi:hypothetical protein